ncbi:lysophospholipid acyltransferase [Alloalcanivorax gelatiniphagus]
MAAVRRIRELARTSLPRAVGERLPAATPQEVTELLHDTRFQQAVADAAREQGRAEDEVWSEVKGYLHEMAAAHDDRTAQGWARMGEWFLRAYDVLVDEDDMHALRRLDRSHSLALAFSHRSYLDGMVIPNALSSRRFSPTYTFGGANLNLPVIGTIASRTGLIFIRRATQEIPVYRLALRSYIRQMVTNKRNMAWSIEGGRTRTGKLRPPVHGILKYLTDTVESQGEGDDAPDVQVVPVSVVYDQLHEVSLMTEESRGASKTPEDWRWLVRFARLQRNRLGRAYLTVGEPFSLRERMAALAAEGVTGHQAVERVALDISHRLNRATPVTVTAIVSLSLLGADRALTVDEVLDTVEPLAAYIDARKWPVAGAADLRDRATIRRALAELARSGVLTAYDGGNEPVWKIGGDQHLVAAFYRNTVIHILVERAIGELALLTVSELEPDAELPAGGELQVAWEEAKRMRDLLKFEFFFPSRAGFEDDLRTELRLLAGEDAVSDIGDLTPAKARELLVDARPHLAHLVLRPFLDAYLVLADRLADRGDAAVDEDDLLADSLAVGRQWALQRRVASAESISLELFRTAMALARHKGLLDGGEGLGSAREAFAAELREAVRRVNIIGEVAGEPVPVVPVVRESR